MKTYLLIVIAALVGALLLSDVSCQKALPPRCGLSGLECKTSSDCCKNLCCVRGICEASTAPKCNPCDEIVCQANEKCEVLKDSNCHQNRKPCKRVPQCVPVKDPCKQQPPPQECVNKDLCFNHTCPEGEKCYVIGGDCKPGDMCIAIIPTPICANPNPCNRTICNPGFECVNEANGNNPPYASCQIVEDPCAFLTCPHPTEQCYIKIEKCKSTTTAITPTCSPSNPCNGVVCREGYMCIIVEDGYYQPFAQCVPTDNVCAYTICEPGESCFVLKRFPPIPVCGTDNDGGSEVTSIGNPCDGLVCNDNEKCYYEKTCMKTSCYLEPRCVPLNPCASIKCSDDYFCHVYVENDLPIGRCTPFADPCAFTVCPKGSTCIILMTYPPQPKCTEPNPRNPCYDKKCPAGTRCETQSVNGKLHAYCTYIRSPCEGQICPANEFCFQTDDNCGIVPASECGSYRPCDRLKCLEARHYCQEYSNIDGPPEVFCVPIVNDPCENITCPNGLKCYWFDFDCLSCPIDSYCTNPNPCETSPCKPDYECVVIDNGILAPQAQCVPIRNPCDSVGCPEFQQCYLESAHCSVDPNQPGPVCAYSNPCNFVICPNGTICSRIQEGNSPPKAQCVQISDPCYGVDCPEHQKCYLRDVECVRAPCFPVPECAYSNPCMFTKCSQYYVCKVQQEGNNPPTAQCVLDYEALCADVECPEYQKCYLINDPCVTAPCTPQTVCDYYDPCMLVRCAGKCVTVDNGYSPPTASCVPNREYICEGTDCPDGQKCYLQDDVCVTELCPPVPQCYDVNPCLVTECAAGYTCHVVDNGDYPPTPECVHDPKTVCLFHECPVYQKCYLMDVYCKTSPGYPEPVCSYPDPCLFVNCREGYKCVGIEEKPKPPTAYCIQNYDVCFGVTCDPGYSCYVKDVECTDFECYPVPPTAVCSLPDPCTNTQCPSNSTCVATQQPRNNPPVAKCLQPESPCDHIVCESYEQCYKKDYDCNETGCFDIVPVGVCALPDPCIAAQCLTNTVCLAVQIRRNPPEPLCGPIQINNPCDDFSCDEGLQCYVKDVECTEFVCTATYPTAVCSLSDPCTATDCEEGTICVLHSTRNNPPVAVCQATQSLCEIITETNCTTGNNCYVKDFECNETGCGYIEPTAVCSYPDPCSFTLCEVGTTCFDEQIRNNPPIAICGSINDPCEIVDCMPRDLCYVKDFECDQYSCTSIKPKAVCAPADPCYEISCLANSVCVPFQIRSNPPQGYCVSYNELCNNVQCADGEKCFIVQVFCIRAPCPPLPMCRPVDPCATTTCLPGYKCVNRQYGVGAPFAECVELKDPCDGVNCSEGQECYLRETYCLCPPCRYEAVCAYPNPCILALCPPDHGCYPKRVGRFEPFVVCYPMDDPCKAYDCLPGQECRLTKIACQPDLPCPVPVCSGDPTNYLCNLARCGPGYECVVDMDTKPLIAKCVPHDDPCDYTICPEGSSCVVLEKYPPIGRCLNITAANPCSVVRCKAGYLCVETDTDPVQANCIPTCKICPPTTDCIVTDKYPPIIRCNPNPKWLITYSPS